MKRMTRELFIARAKLIHEDYDYSKVIYINSKTKIILICPKHGEFLITPNAVLSQKQGCPICGGSKKSTTEEFINKAKKIFPDYIYDKVRYQNNKTKVIIVCPKHGDFFTKPNSLLNKEGCPLCGKENRILANTKSKEEFIRKAKLIFPNYDYSKVKYINENFKISVICNIHGEFKITPHNLLSKHGCQKCANEKIKKKLRYSTSEFISLAKQVHPEYDYTKVEYINCRTKIAIGCPKHGIFFMKPSVLLRNHGCPKCRSELIGNIFRSNTNDFIIKAKRVFPEYDYSKVDYKNSTTKVEIVCSKHGIFYALPGMFLQGHGCPSCNQSKGETKIRNWLLENNVSFESQKKFSDLRKKKPLSYDFYLPTYNILIEFNGRQHYEYVDVFHRNGIADLEKQIEHDKLKQEFAHKNHIKLIIIDDINEIDKILRKHLITK